MIIKKNTHSGLTENVFCVYNCSLPSKSSLTNAFQYHRFLLLYALPPNFLIVQNSYRSIAQCFATTSLPNCSISYFLILLALQLLPCLIAQFPIALLLSALLLLP
jgi:hypothetical protein